MLGLADLPEELILRICFELDCECLLSFGQCSKALHLFIQDASLFEHLLQDHFPVAHARLRQARQRRPLSSSSWERELRHCVRQQQCCTTRRALAYKRIDLKKATQLDYESSVPSTAPEVRVVRPRLWCNYGRLIHVRDSREDGQSFHVLDLASEQVVRCALPAPFHIRSIACTESYIHVLTTRSLDQWVFSFDLDGVMRMSCSLETSSMHVIAANSSFVVVGDARDQWLQIDLQSNKVTRLAIPDESMQAEGQELGSSVCAADEDFFYFSSQQTRPRCWNFREECWMSLDTEINSCAELTFFFASDGLVYNWCNDRLSILHGSTKHSARACKELPSVDDVTWAIQPIFNLGGFAEWQGNEESVNFGLYTFVGGSRESALKDVGRLLGPSEPAEQQALRNVLLLGDHRWLVLVDMVSQEVQAWDLG